MFSVATDWNPKQANLKSIILKPEYFDEAITLSLELHSMVHDKQVSSVKDNTFADEVFESVSDECFNEITYDKGRTFAYNVWHITRIEDICSNILIADGEQVISSDNWIEKLKSTVTDTGNALTADEISDFSLNINREELFAYRIAVGKKSREILRQLKPADMKRKMQASSLRRIIDENAVSTKEESIWLIDFWGKKNVAGLIQMPLTRHQIVHLNDCIKIKKKSLKT